jgi:protein TonB
MADMPFVMPQWEHAVSSRSHACLAWLLSLALHAVALVLLVYFYHALETHPIGGGGGGTDSGGGSFLAVDLSGLGCGDAGPLSGSDTAATDAETEPTLCATLPTSAQEATPEETPVAKAEQATPVLAETVEHAAKTEHKSRPSRKAPAHRLPVAAASTAGQSATPTASGGDAQAGPSGSGPGMAGGASGHSGGSGGGNGGGAGPAEGAGQGLGDEQGLSLAVVEVKPKILRQVEPAYPDEARRHGIEGRVVARLLVTADGGVNAVSIVSAQPPQVFDQAVMAALGKWRFHPARHKGREVATWVMLPIKFDLKN